MKIAIVDPYYPMFLEAFYRAHPSLRTASSATQRQALLDQSFGTADYYSRNLAPLGHEATELIVNAEPLQLAWAREQSINIQWSQLRRGLGRIPYLNRLFPPPDWIQEIALKQIEAAAPDILYCQDLTILRPETLQAARRIVRFVIGQIASPIPPSLDLSPFDLIITAAPHFVPQFRSRGFACEYLKIGFESSLVPHLTDDPVEYDCVFIGGFSRHHATGSRVIETLLQSVKVDLWGYGIEDLPQNSPILDHFHGPAWGIQMYQILKRAKICINRHVDVAREYAGNMRLFEATGVGTMLITDMKKNLTDFFVPGREVETYRTPAELVQKVRYYLTHDDERAAIARAGQERTLRDHTYAVRMRELDQILRRHVPGREQGSRRGIWRHHLWQTTP